MTNCCIRLWAHSILDQSVYVGVQLTQIIRDVICNLLVYAMNIPRLTKNMNVIRRTTNYELYNEITIFTHVVITEESCSDSC